MPSTVAALFAAAQVSRVDAVPWRSPVPTDRPGVYLVARTADPERAVVAPVAIDSGAVRRLLAVRPELLVDDRRPSEEMLAQRLGSMWLPDEPVIYAGLAGTSLSTRIRQFYSTRLGARSPHAGGWPVKCLADLDQAWVHFAECDDVKAAERDMLHAFMKAVSSQSLAAVCDPGLPLPYANLEFIDTTGRRRIKGHRIKGAKARR